MTAPHAARLNLTGADRQELTRLEENMWREEGRFDMSFMEKHLADDFFEFGRSGKTYMRAQSLTIPRQPTDVVLPLPNFDIRLLNQDTAPVTYFSVMTYDGIVEHGRRSSIWSRTQDGGWCAHQGALYEP